MGLGEGEREYQEGGEVARKREPVLPRFIPPLPFSRGLLGEQLGSGEIHGESQASGPSREILVMSVEGAGQQQGPLEEDCWLVLNVQGAVHFSYGWSEFSKCKKAALYY